MPAEKEKKRKKPGAVRKQTARKRFFHLFLVLFLIGSAVMAGDIIRRKVTFFPLREVAVTGNRHLSAEEIVQLSGVRQGAGILSVSAKSVVANLRKSPWVKEVSIRKELPDRILIRITEAEPVALFKKDEGYYLVDAGGVFLEKQTSEEKFLPVIAGDAGNRKALQEAIRLAEVLRDRPSPGGENPEIVYRNIDDLSIRFGKAVIKMGYGGYREKLERYLELQDEISRRGIPVESVDLRYDRRVVVRTSDRGSE